MGVMKIFLFLFLFFPVVCSATGVLRAYFSPPPVGSNVVSLILKNTGTDDINIVEYTLPWLMKDGRLMNSAVVNLTTQDGDVVRYRGAFLDYNLSDPERFVTIRPGGERRYDVDMSVNYDIEPGRYYVVGSLMKIKYLDRSLSSYPDRSNSALRRLYRVDVATSVGFTAAPIVRRRAVDVQSGFYEGCTKEQLDIFDEIKFKGNYLIANAYQEMIGMYAQAFSGGWVSTPNYIRWFGLHWPFSGVGDVIHEEDDYWAWVVSATWARTRGISVIDLSKLPDVTVTCECSGGHGENVMANAWVERDVHYQINSCPKYWSLQMDHDIENPDVSSQVGTYIHEITHFNDVMNRGTRDLSYSYSDTVDISQQHGLAVDNAQSYKFWILRQP